MAALTFFFLIGTFLGCLAGSATVVLLVEVIVRRPLRRLVTKQKEMLRDAQIDVEIVRAIRRGEIDAADLRELDLAPEYLAPERPKLDRDGAEHRKNPLWNALTESDHDYRPYASTPAPRFVPNMVKRCPSPNELVPGDQNWVSPTEIYLDPKGRPMLRLRADLHTSRMEWSPVRLRVYDDGSIEAALAEGTTVGLHCPPNDDARPIARFHNLTTKETREFDWSDRSTKDTTETDDAG